MMQWNLVCIGSVVAAAAAIWQLEGERKEEGEKKMGGEERVPWLVRTGGRGRERDRQSGERRRGESVQGWSGGCFGGLWSTMREGQWQPQL